MFRIDLSSVPGELVAGEMVAGELLEALWLWMDEEDVADEDYDGGEEEEDSGDEREDEDARGSCSNPEEEQEDSEEDSEEDQDQGDGGHASARRPRRITRQRVIIADTMSEHDYR